MDLQPVVLTANQQNYDECDDKVASIPEPVGFCINTNPNPSSNSKFGL